MEEFYKEIISKNFEIFESKFKEAKSNIDTKIKLDLNDYNVRICSTPIRYRIKFENKTNKKIIKFTISHYSRKMNFKKSNKSNWHFIVNSEDIEKYIKKYQFDHPTYYSLEKNKNISISSGDYNKIFEDIKISEISDDEYIEYISPK